MDLGKTHTLPNGTQYAQDIKKRYKAGTLGDDVKRKLLMQSGKYYRREYWYCKDESDNPEKQIIN